MKLFDSELKVMDVLWRDGDRTAKQISAVLKESTGWNQNTTYTVIKKCVAKGAIERREPGFLCHALIGRDEVRAEETETLLSKFFDDSPDLLFASLLDRRKLSREQVDNLRRIVAELEERE